MKIYLYLIACMTVALGSLAPHARADEVWDTGEYQVIYQDDRLSTAIWTYDEGRGTVFIEGLGGVFEGRKSYQGYWVQESASLRCDTYREGGDGLPSHYWGRFEITFINPDFPSHWQAKLGRCEQEPFIPLTGTPVTNF